MATQIHPPRSNPTKPSPPPTNHTLRPRHLALMNILLTIFFTFRDKKLPPEFLIHVHRVLLEEIAEVRQPLSCSQLQAEISRGAKASHPVVAEALKEMLNLKNFVLTPGHLVTFFQIPVLYNEPHGKLAPRSLFGYFARRCRASFQKLSVEGMCDLYDDFHKWVKGELDEESIYIKKDVITNNWNIYKTTSEKKGFPRPDAYELWEKGLAVGDETRATENLRRFFEQRFHEGNDSGVRQHALLNLARMHYLRHEHVACRKLLEEAITVARTSNDKQTLQHCIGLVNRLPHLDRNRKMPINELQPDLNPSEVLHDVKKLLVVNSQQPLSAAFEKIAQAASLYDLWADSRRDQVSEDEQWGQHAVQSAVWGLLGNSKLASIEENVVLAFSPARTPDNTRLIAILNRTYRDARQGRYRDAISMLLDPDVWIGLEIADYQMWATQIWHIFVLRASRRGQSRMISDFLSPKRFTHGFTPKEYIYGPSQSINSLIRDPLHDVLAMREVNQGQSAIQPLLTSLWHSEFQQRYGSYRPGLILLADISLEFGLTKWCRRILEEMMPQVISGDDLEQRAFACFTLARCIIASADSMPDALRECIHYLEIAEADYAAIEIYRSLQDTQFLLSVVYHNLNMIEDRDQVAQRHAATEKLAAEAQTIVTEDWVTEILDVVSDVGTALAGR